MYALVDCNNFFASCERVFNPKLQNKPMVVLSNNDGCIVARSNEVKKMGIPMGAPYFKYRNTLDRFNVHICSSNFSLYGDMSLRVMQVLREHSFVDMIYSVDEAFLDLSGVADPIAHARELRALVLQWVGIPVSIGIAPTKTLAKLTNEYAKKHEEYGGVLSFGTPHVKQLLFASDIEDVWGIGRNISKQLHSMGVTTVQELVDIPLSTIRGTFGVSLERTVLELQGISCAEHMHKAEDRKSIIRSRSFPKKVTEKMYIKEAISTHVMTASRKLRSLNIGAQYLTVYFRTSAYEPGERYSASDTHTFLGPINNTFTLTKAALHMVDNLYRPGIRYAKAGVVLTGLSSMSMVQSTFFQEDHKEQTHAVFHAVDALNKKFGNNTLFLGATGIHKEWKIKNEWRSNKFTSDWNEIPLVR